MTEPLFEFEGDSWETVTLGDICRRGGGNVQTGPFGSQLHSSDYVADGVPSIMPLNIGDNRINTEGIARIREEDAQRLSRYRLKSGDIVYSRRGDVERRSLVRSSEDGWLCGTGCLRVRLGEGVADPAFVSYYLGHSAAREWIVSHAVGSIMPNLNTAILSAIPVVLPPLDEQRRIAKALEALDDKIELNRQMNRTLEETAGALYRSWFVDFDPVVAKAAGRAPAHLSPALAALFPAAFQDSDLGPIPKGWRIGKLDEVLVLQRGFDLPAGSRTAGPYPIIAASGLNGTHHEFKVKGPGVTTGRSGVLGKVYYVEEDFWPLNTSLWIKEYPLGSPLHAYHLLQGMEIETYNAGSAVPTLNRNHVHNLPVVIPPPALVEAFEAQARPLFQMRHHNQAESQTLAALRDTLLPKLLSGEVRVKLELSL